MAFSSCAAAVAHSQSYKDDGRIATSHSGVFFQPPRSVIYAQEPRRRCWAWSWHLAPGVFTAVNPLCCLIVGMHVDFLTSHVSDIAWVLFLRLNLRIVAVAVLPCMGPHFHWAVLPLCLPLCYWSTCLTREELPAGMGGNLLKSTQQLLCQSGKTHYTFQVGVCRDLNQKRDFSVQSN